MRDNKAGLEGQSRFRRAVLDAIVEVSQFSL